MGATALMSASELVFSSTMVVAATAPTSQPARVKGTHGAGPFTTALLALVVRYWGVLSVPRAEGVGPQAPNPPLLRELTDWAPLVVPPVYVAPL